MTCLNLNPGGMTLSYSSTTDSCSAQFGGCEEQQKYKSEAMEMETSPPDACPGLDESCSNLIVTKGPVKPKKRLLKQLTLLDFENRQHFFDAKRPKPIENVMFLKKPRTSSQKADAFFCDAQKRTSLVCNNSAQSVESLQEIKENIEGVHILSERSCANDSGKACVGIFPNLEQCKYAVDADAGTDAYCKENKPMNESAPKPMHPSLHNYPSCFLINESPQVIEKTIGEDESWLANKCAVSPNTCFIDLETPPNAHDPSFSTRSHFPKELETLPSTDYELSRTPINFSTVKVSELGITPETFTFKSSDKPQSSLSKLRRRSTVGVRGSPETNHLIRYIAHQRSDAVEDPCAMSSPFRSGKFSLKEKISAFRASFLSLEEREQNATLPGVLEDGVPEAQNNTVKSTLLKPQKAPDFDRGLPSQLNELASVEQLSPFAKNGFNDQRVKTIPCGTLRDSCSRNPDRDVFHGSPVMGITPVKCSNSRVVLDTKGRENQSPSFWKQAFAMETKVAFTKHLTPEKQQSLTSLGTFQDEMSLACIQPSPNPSLRPVLKKTATKHGKDYKKGHAIISAEETSLLSDSSITSVTKRPKCVQSRTVLITEKENLDESKELQKRKRVTFGRDLSPEIFDKTLPANTPLRRGRTPDRCGNLSSTKILVEVVSPIQLEPIEQPDFDSTEECTVSFEGSAPVVSTTNTYTADNIAEHAPTSSHDSDLTELQASLLLNCEQTSTPSPPELPLQINSSIEMDKSDSQESHDIQVSDYKSDGSTCKGIAVTESVRVTRSALKRKSVDNLTGAALDDSFSLEVTNTEQVKLELCNTQPQTAKRKTVVKKRSIKLKVVRRKGRGRKQKLLCVAKETVSKKPLLSPIFEVPEIFSSTPSTSPACALLAVEDLSMSSDDNRMPVTNRKVMRKKRSARGTGQYYTDSSDDSSEEPQSDQVNENDEASLMDKSVDEQESVSPQISVKDQSFQEDESPTPDVEIALPLSIEIANTSEVDTTLYDVEKNAQPLALNPQEICGHASNEESSSVTIENIHSQLTEAEPPENMSSGLVLLPATHTNNSRRRQSRRLSLQVSTSSAATVDCSMQNPSVTKPTQSFPRIKKVRRVSCETSQAADDASVRVQALEKHTSLPARTDDVGMPGGACTSYSQDYVFPMITDAVVGKIKCSKNNRRNTIFCFHPDNILETMSAAANPVLPIPPQELDSRLVSTCKDEPEACTSDDNFNIEETLQSGKTTDRSVRRSMRLRRGSGVVGLNWVHESTPEKEAHKVPNTSRKLRRSFVNASTLKEKNSPTPKIALFLSPGKGNFEQHTLFCISGKPSRRRTLCSSTILQTSNIDVLKIKKGRRSFKVKAAMGSVKTDELEPTTGNQAKSEPV
ncbi:cell division cycle-associated protein 2 isoform X2 [Ambystoma mexicanum]|uniref:cell division cycle-associated protein 2 isoform X2 n=1 Tax=Ambystoma mexicanum TaxID=8296 RepID=UPI0037E811C1